MISLTRLNHSEIYVNAELIEYVESTPDTVLTLTTGAKLLVEESAPEVVSRVIAYRQRVTGLERPRASPHEASASGLPWPDIDRSRGGGSGNGR